MFACAILPAQRGGIARSLRGACRTGRVGIRHRVRPSLRGKRLLTGRVSRLPQDRPTSSSTAVRYVAWDDRKRLPGIWAWAIALIRVGTEFLTIFGVIDLCAGAALPASLSGHADVADARSLGARYPARCYCAVCRRPPCYAANGYQRIETPCTWMMIDDHRTLGITTRSLGDSMMVKPITLPRWPDGAVDLLGYLS